MIINVKKREKLIEQLANRGICAICKGTKMLCGKSECPLLVRYYSLLKNKKKMGREIDGSSPPGVFVGRYGYPKVNIGPLIPPEKGDTEYMDIPEFWIDMNIKEFVDMRTSLIRGMKKVRVNMANEPDYFILDLQELSMANKHVDTEVIFEKIPHGRIVAGSEIQPYGPAAPLKKIIHDNVKVNPKLEKIYYDELKASESILHLYKEGVRVSLIQKAFSMGTMGVNRKIVPTRWSITAVDDTISKHLVSKIKEFGLVDKSMVFMSNKMGNLFAVIFLPRMWSYELVEAWYPGTLWNPYGKRIFMVSSHEYFESRKDYAEIGGCYYAARLAVGEKLIKMRRQAEVIVLREAQPSYLMPVGVWHVRENVRSALRNQPESFDRETDAINYALSHFHIPQKYWLEGSKLLNRFLHQRRLEDFEIY